MNEEAYMLEALALAEEAARCGEVPVGCVIADENGVIIGRGRNRREETKSALSHAEMDAISEACTARGSWRLDGCSLYVTLEPCPMCAGTILNARLKRVFYGARDPAFGACGGVVNLFVEPWPHVPELYGGILAEPCLRILQDFFKKFS